jgi:hypothetical protein
MTMMQEPNVFILNYIILKNNLHMIFLIEFALLKFILNDQKSRSNASLNFTPIA